MPQQAVDTGHRVMTTGSDDEHEHGSERAGEQSSPLRAVPEGSDHDVTGGNRSEDPTLGALDALTRALQQIAKDQGFLEERLVELRRQRASGRPWREILAEEEPPGTMQVVSRMLACLAKASGTLRKELVDTLRREGVSIPAIARLFGVTHQRVSNLLRRPPD